MSFPLVLALLQLSAITPEHHVIVFGSRDSVAFESAADVVPPMASQQAKFFRQFAADLARPTAFAAPLDLTAFPVYGREVPGAQGAIQIHPTFIGGLVVKVSLEGMLPNHRYVLTLNGSPEKPGNDELPTSVHGNPLEHYFDFQTITTDVNGAYLADYAIALPPHAYEIRFYVKDTADFKIVLYHDFFAFTVE